MGLVVPLVCVCARPWCVVRVNVRMSRGNTLITSFLKRPSDGEQEEQGEEGGGGGGNRQERDNVRHLQLQDKHSGVAEQYDKEMDDPKEKCPHHGPAQGVAADHGNAPRGEDDQMPHTGAHAHAHAHAHTHTDGRAHALGGSARGGGSRVVSAASLPGVYKSGTRGLHSKGERSLVGMLKACAGPAAMDSATGFAPAHAAAAAAPAGGGGGRACYIDAGSSGGASARHSELGARPAAGDSEAAGAGLRASASHHEDPPCHGALRSHADGEQVSPEVLAALPAELREEIEINMRLARLSPRKVGAGKAGKAHDPRAGVGGGIKRLLSQDPAGGLGRQGQRKRDGKVARLQGAGIDTFFTKRP